jgi:hypothetical protein
MASADLDFAKQIGFMLEQICDTLGQKSHREDIYNVGIAQVGLDLALLTAHRPSSRFTSDSLNSTKQPLRF